jgi:hypothetical protein
VRWIALAPGTKRGGQPLLKHIFEHMVSGIVEAEPDVFIVLSVPKTYTTRRYS